jgi:CRP-like cAMP-binding protein
MAEDAYSYISRFVTLTDEERKLFLQHLQIMTCSPKQVLTRVGDMEQHVYFIQKGLVRKYFMKGREEVTVQLSSEGDLVSSSVSFLSGVPSDFVLETMEPSTLAFMTKSSLESLFQNSTNFEIMGRLITLEWMLYKERWDISRMIKPPKERFTMLCQEKPGLMNRVPQKYLASLLDIEPETFSRYKKQVAVESENP